MYLLIAIIIVVIIVWLMCKSTKEGFHYYHDYNYPYLYCEEDYFDNVQCYPPYYYNNRYWSWRPNRKLHGPTRRTFWRHG